MDEVGKQDTSSKPGEAAHARDKEGRKQEALHFTRSWERIIHSKTARRLWVHFGVGENEIQGLSIVAVWLMINCKEGGSEGAIIKWSGARASWMRKVRDQIEMTVRGGLLERVQVPGGFLLCITERGERVMTFYDRQFDLELEAMRERKESRMQDIYDRVKKHHEKKVSSERL